MQNDLKSATPEAEPEDDYIPSMIKLDLLGLIAFLLISPFIVWLFF